MSKYADIIERLEKAEGPSEELGVRIKCALLAPDGAYVEQSKFNYAWCIYHGEHNGKPRLWEYRGVSNELRLSDPTASIDAAIALVERMLPGYSWKIVGEPDAVYLHCAVLKGTGKLGNVAPTFVASQRTAPLAILLAFFLALDAQETSK